MQGPLKKGTSVIVIPIRIEVSILLDLYFHGINPVDQICRTKSFTRADIGKLFKRRGSIKDILFRSFPIKLEAVEPAADASQCTVDLLCRQEIAGNFM